MARKSVDICTIGTLARVTGCKAATIRYYEAIALMPMPIRSSGGQRVYTAADARRLTFIRHSRRLGFSLDDIRGFLALAAHPEQPCAEADAIAARHLQAVRDRIQHLKLLEKELKLMVGACDGQSTRRCRVIETLADHGRCRYHQDERC